jgi:opacity protein-like surface antigen
MKKLLCLLFFILSSSFFILAQDYVRPETETHVSENKKYSIGVSFGPAIPFKDFASSNVKGSFWDFSSPDSTRLQGFAKTGFHFNITASCLFTDNIGMMLFVGGNSNSFDATSFSSAIGYPASVSSGNYYTAEYLIGPFVSFSVADKIRINACALFGFVTNSYPVINIALNDTTTLQVNFTSALNFGYRLGAGVEYSVNKNISVVFQVAYLQSNITYPSWSETYTIPGYYPLNQTHSTDVTTMTTGILSPTIGLKLKY